MDVPSPQHGDAWASHVADRADDPRPSRTPCRKRRIRRATLCGAVLSGLIAVAASADTLRLATYHTELSGRGPGLILRDLLRMEDVAAATVAVILEAQPDILALQDFDYDGNGVALATLADALAEGGVDYPHRLTLRPNTGHPTGFDLDGDGRADGPRDAHGYGRFSGQGGMALLSRYPLGDVRDFSDVLWRDLPENAAADVTPEDALPILRLHTVGAWDVEVLTPNGPIHILTSHATTPVFDGPEDRNGLRNADEVRFWQLYVEGWAPDTAPFAADHFAIMGTFNVDPNGVEGLQGPVRALLSHPALQNPVPDGPTTDWDEPTPGDLRVDYLLPSRTLSVQDAGVLWPVDGPLADVVAEASDHRLVWVDVAF